MADPSDAVAAHMLTKAITASLQLTNNTVDSLTLSQLHAIQFRLCETLGVVRGTIQEHENAVASGEFFWTFR
jgi:hypothetical protein